MIKLIGTAKQCAKYPDFCNNIFSKMDRFLLHVQRQFQNPNGMDVMSFMSRRKAINMTGGLASQTLSMPILEQR
jgi:hypothetical protein